MLGAEGAGDFLLHLHHADVLLGQVIVEGHVEVVHECEGFGTVLVESFKQVSGLGLLACAALLLGVGRPWRQGIPGIAVLDDVEIPLLECPELFLRQMIRVRSGAINGVFDIQQAVYHVLGPVLVVLLLHEDHGYLLAACPVDDGGQGFGTGAVTLILDGDLLSARGFIVAPNSVLLPSDVPAGLPARGVDFGLDAVTSGRRPSDNPMILFSTEILYRGERRFTDGDVLLMGDGIKMRNEDLIAAWHPRADFLGLDALWLLTEPPPLEDPFITHLCGDRSAGDFDGGLVGIGGAGTGLYRNGPPDAAWPDGRPRQPCGRFVPVDGFMPDTGVVRFRVAYRKAGDPYLGVDTHDGIQTSWRIYQRAPFWPFPCTLSGSLSTDAKGWMDAATYQGYKTGALTGGCPNTGLKLAVWNTDGVPGFDPGPADPNGHYVLWLEFDDGAIDREPVEHHLQLDNTLPKINDFKVTLADGTTPVNACGEAPNGEHIFKVYADFYDDYHWGYKLRVRGGDPPAGKTYGWHNYYDGTPAVVNTDRTGTTPTGNTVFLRNIDMNDLGASFTDCCYVLDLWVRDGAIRHSFNKRVTNDVTGANGWWANRFLTFAAAP